MRIKIKQSLKWLLFTLISTFLSAMLLGLSFFTIAFFATGFIFSIGYLYKEELIKQT
ncbi:hypothetical protein M4D55_15620 [Metabacillus idriensis]|uniref:hypothetical protein n=1 Tax=Metabacillus idriensis TaxID=324768 RepID=UPI00203CC6F2|nr:hypothetical protein [Metabacillus idriensis]MCM3597203.1 hypothetical protein [Metabacillus idriensis]